MAEDLADKFRNFVESIAKRVPGYAGYLKREERRESDKLLRDHLEKSLRAHKEKLDRIAVKITDAGSLGLLKPINTATKMMEKVVDKVRFADQGYAGFFDLERIGEPELERLYNFDVGLEQSVDEIGKKVAKVAGAMGGVAETEAALAVLVQELEKFNDKLSERDDAMTGGVTDG